MTAEAKVILTAQDRTAAAFRSAKANLDSFNRGLGSVKSLLSTFGVGFSVAAITTGMFNAAKSAIEFGDEVQKAATRTGLSAAEFGLLAKAAKRADVDIGTLSKGLRAMLVNVSEASAGGTKSGPGKIFSDLQINVEEFKKLNAQKQLEELADAIAALKDPSDVARAGTALFGKSWQDFAPWLSEGAKGLREATTEITRMGGALSDDQYATLGKADDAVKDLETAWDNFAQKLTVKTAPTIIAALDAISNALSDDPIQVAPGKALDSAIEAIKKNGISTKWSDILIQIQSDEKARRSLEDAMWSYVGATESAGKPKKDRPSTLPTSTETDAERRARLKKELDAQFPDITLSAQKFTTSAVDEVNKAIREQSLPQYQRDAEQWAKEAADAYAALAAGSLSPELYAARLSELNSKYLDEIKITAEKILPPETVTQLSVFAEQAGRNIQDAFANFLFDPFKDGLKGMLAGFADMVRRMVAELAAKEILTAFFGWMGGFNNVFGSIGKSMLKGITGKAGGGPVMAGVPYKVGERGAEMFVPSSNGMIVPNHALAGGVNLNYTIDARGADAERIMAIMPGLLKRTKDEAVGEIRSLVNRGRM